jgi:lipoprotein-anchoring transpeptidase ErfK/SrfK
LEVVGSVKPSLRLAVCLTLIGMPLAAAPAQASWFDWSGATRGQISQSDPAPADQPKRRAHRSTRYDKAAGKFPTPTGPLTIVVSIAKQRVTLFSDGKQIAEAPVSTGTAGHETPLGVFAVISKARYHESNIYSGAPMPYMERITWSGIALHEGPLPGHAASHGCIRLPGSFAASLFKITKLGARVIVVRDPVAPVEIKSARLFTPKLPSAPGEPPKEVPSAAAPATTGTVQLVDARDDGVKPDGTAGEDFAAKLAVAGIIKLPGRQAALPDAAKPAEAQKKKGAVQVFVSRKTGRLYVRQNFAPLFDAAVTIADPDKPWGTHVFTAMEIKDGKARWTALTIPSGYASKPEHGKKLSTKDTERRAKLAFDLAQAPQAAEALERFEMPKDAVDRISELLVPGSSLIVSDNALSDETGEDTDFIVATH